MPSESMETCDESMHDAVFRAAVDIIQSMPRKGLINISVNQKLRFYSLFKQGMNGKCNVPCPPFWHTVDRMKWRAWDALGSMDSLEAKKTYVTELKKIIDRVLHEYNIADLAKECDESTKELLKQKLAILGYDVSSSKMRQELNGLRKQSYIWANESCEVRRHINTSETNDFSDQCSESSTSNADYVDAVCCGCESCVYCREQSPNQRTNEMNGFSFLSSTFDFENLKIFIQRHLKIIVNLLMYLRRLFVTFLLNFKGYVGNRWKLTAITIILPIVAHFIMVYFC